MRPNYLLKFIFLLLLTSTLQAQRQAENWHFGNDVSVTFADGPPALLTASAMETFEGCTSYSNPQGQLLFYTNGGGRPDVTEQDAGTIWNRNHEVMYDMQGREGGGFSARQSSIAFPVPGEIDQYYLFTMEEQEFDFGGSFPDQPQGRGLSYFIIDMSLNGGLGGVIVADQRVYLPTYEGLSATPMTGDETGHWVVCTDQLGQSLVVVPVTADGVGEPLENEIEGLVEGQIKISPDGRHIFGDGQLFTFDAATGVVSPTPFFSDPNLNSLTTSFTADGRYLYSVSSAGGQRLLVRFDLTAADIPASAVVLANLENGFSYQMQIASNGNLYFLETTFAGASAFGLSEISCPSTSMPTFTRRIVDLTGNSEDLFTGLPNYVDAIFLVPAPDNDTVAVGNEARGLCPGGDITLIPSAFGEAYTWSNGADSREITVMEAGTYSVTITGGCQPFVETFPVVDQPLAEVSVNPLEGDLLCPGDSVTLGLEASQELDFISWPDGSSGFTYRAEVVSGTTVSVGISDGCSRRLIEFTFPVEEVLTAELTTDFMAPLCPGDEVTFSVAGDFIEASIWEDSSTELDRTVVADSSINYQLTVFSRCNDSLVLTPELDYSLCPLVCEAEIPNLISPNRDGINDGFKVFTACELEDYAIRIFNRWGQIVFSSDIPDQAWDGSYEGVDQPMDVYLYQVRYRFPNNPDTEERDGEFQLIR